ncbi:inositol-tetrakisphosphate 1-kinase-like [Paramacrobiotus metropolitanus]|uniref:inositol-tetrakisphosphate 1-kinase-like n=1 Tax=Paramacrobiotus metropolitanus TaxID=2943436 RepID=UPI002445A6D9|nr:inositol-tetrakisphosphate 1-kinase-like [Paramacrobiotus metropolitanus]
MEPFMLNIAASPEVKPKKRNGFYPSCGRIGFWMSAKKQKKMDMSKFALICRKTGYELVEVDFGRPLEQQGPFDIFLHKLTDMIVRAEQTNSTDHAVRAEAEKAAEFFHDLQEYQQSHPELIVIDPVDNLKKLLLRQRQYHLTASSPACRHEMVFSPAFIELSATAPEEMLQQLQRGHVQFPIVCKPQEAHGSSDAHHMMIIFNATGLESIKVPCVAQSFVNHDAILYKVFVIGDKHHVVRRPSFENFYLNDLPPIVFDSQDISKAQWLCSDPSKLPLFRIAANSINAATAEVELDPAVVSFIVQGIRQQFGLSLIGIDLIREVDTGRLAIIDVNAFPSYDGVPDFFGTLSDFLHSTVKHRSAILSREKNGLNTKTKNIPRSFQSVTSATVIRQ